jgi:EAL domain-containing protein (putative c-di-GMP-specific phosphodiesterase class I)/GGDEF domain-containing protein
MSVGWLALGLLYPKRFGGGLFGSTRRTVIAVTILAIAPPLILLFTSKIYWATRTADNGRFWLLVCVLACLFSIAVVAWALRPISVAAKAMRELAAAARPTQAPQKSGNDLADLLADIGIVASRFDALRSRFINQHPGTGFATREPFLAELGGEMEGACPPTLLALARMGDFDRMAAFDRRAAELALEVFGRRLQDAARKSLGLAQVDRDCFAIWFRSTELEEATAELRAVGYVLGQDLSVADQTIAPDVTLGCAVYPHDAKDATGLLACAFAALPKTGTLQPGAVNFFSSANSKAARRTFLLEQGLRNAIGEDQFFLQYQPVVDVSRARVGGAEALLRWRHPELGLVSPAEFIPILEQSGPIDEVGLWVLNTACRDARGWRRRGLSDLTIAVNLSACQFRGPTLAMTIVRTLERHGLAPSDLEVELTETAAMEDAVRTREVLEQLRALGVGVAIDDFGAGYSSLSYLKNLPITKLKIDREFVLKVHERPDSQAICSALVALANGLNIKLLAEGAEEREEVETLVRLGCSMFQGYFFAKPQSAADFALTVSDAAWLDKLGLGAADLKAPTRRRRA